LRGEKCGLGEEEEKNPKRGLSQAIRLKRIREERSGEERGERKKGKVMGAGQRSARIGLKPSVLC